VNDATGLAALAAEAQAAKADVAPEDDIPPDPPTGNENAAQTDTAADFITVLTSLGPPLTKRWYLDAGGKPACEPYGKARWFSYERVPIGDLADIARIIASLGPTQCLILGKLRDGVDPTNALRRLYPRRCKDGSIEPATIEDAAHCWLPLDIDSVPARDDVGEFDPIADPERALACIMPHLPAELQEADCLWQWTGGAGLKPGIRLRLFFWLSCPMTGAKIKSWLAPYIKTVANPDGIIDGSIFTPTQPIYAAAPLFDDGANPIAQRCGIRRGWGEVPAPEIAATGGKQGRKDANTPSDQCGIGGPADVVFDDPETIKWAIEAIERDLAEHGEPTDGIGDHTDDRIYRLIGRLQDGDRWGYSVSRAMIAELLSARWAPHFDYEWVEGKAAGGHYQNDPGVGQGGSSDRAFGAAIAKYGDPSQYASDNRGAGAPSYVESLRRIRDAAGRGEGPRYDPPPAPPMFMTAAELDAYAVPVEEDVWQGLVLRQLVNLLYGDGESGKTMLSAHIAVACAAGLSDLFGHRVMKAPALMVLCEDAYKRVQPTMRAICAHLGIKLADLPITLCCRPDDPVLAIIGDKGETAATAFLLQLCERIAKLGECLVVLDTVSDIAQLNENLRLPPNALVKKILQPVCDVFGATILVTAHPSAAQIKDGRLGSGSTAWRNAVRNSIGLTKNDAGLRHLRNIKDSYGNRSSLYLSMTGPLFTRIAAPAAEADADVDEIVSFRARLAGAGAYGWRHGLTGGQMAELIEGRAPDENDVDATTAWRTAMQKRRKELRNKRRYPKWRALGNEQCQPGGAVLIWRWFLPESERPADDDNLDY
jgi:hypothetical protein